MDLISPRIRLPSFIVLLYKGYNLALPAPPPLIKQCPLVFLQLQSLDLRLTPNLSQDWDLSQYLAQCLYLLQYLDLSIYLSLNLSLNLIFGISLQLKLGLIRVISGGFNLGRRLEQQRRYLALFSSILLEQELLQRLPNHQFYFTVLVGKYFTLERIVLQWKTRSWRIEERQN